MKKPVNWGICSLLMALFLFAVPAGALAEEAGRAGLFGEIRLGGGGASIRPSGLDVLDDNESIESLDSKGSKETEVLVLLGAELGYTFEKTGTSLLAAIGSEGNLSLSLHQDTGGIGELTLSALYEKNEVWQDPYLAGIHRSRTDAEALGFGVNWEHILGTKARLFFEHMNIDVEDDLIGQLESDLRRDGNETTLGLGYVWDLAAAGMLSPSLSHVWVDREGSANRGNDYVAALEHVITFGRLTFVTNLEMKNSRFDGVHPAFDKRRKESAYGISEMVSFAEPFGLTDWSLLGFAAYGRTDSNISFFDRTSLLAGAGLGYKF